MVFATLDQIVRRTLLEKGLPIHYYCEVLFHAAASIREMAKDSLKIINAVNVPLTDYNAIDLPGDFMDDLGVCLPSGGELQHLPKRSNLNPLRLNNATTGAFEPYTTAGLDNGEEVIGFDGSALWFWNVSDWGEPLGRVFGSTGGNPDGYEVFKERRQIQLYGAYTSGCVILQYISDGQSVDNASMVDTMAFSTIQAWINWKMSPNANNQFSPEGNSYTNQRRKLRARLNDLTPDDIRNTIHKAYTAARKT